MAHKKLLKLSITLLLLTVLGMSYYFKFEYHKDLNKLIKAAIDDRLPSNYTCNFEDITITDDLLLLQKFNLIHHNTQKDTLWSVRLDEFEVDQFDLSAFLTSNIIALDSIRIKQPEIIIHALPKQENSPQNPSNQFETRLEIDKLTIDNGSIEYHPNSPLNFYTKVSGTIENIRFPFDHKTIKKLSNSSKLIFSSTNINLPDSTQKISLDSIIFSPTDSTIIVSNFRLTPNMSIKDHFNYYKWNKGYQKLFIREIRIAYPQVATDSVVRFSDLSIDSLSLSIYKDAHYTLPNRITELPQELLEHLPIKLSIDTISIKRSRLSLTTLTKNNKRAKIRLANINAVARVQNVDISLPALSFNANASLQNHASFNFKAYYEFGENCPFRYKATLNKVSLLFLNDFMNDLAALEITKGQVEHLLFTAEGNKYMTYGNMNFLYSDLHVHLLDKESGHQKKILNKLSDAIGGLIFWKNNPQHEQLRDINFKITRDARKAFPGQWVDALLKGLIETIVKVEKIKEKVSPDTKS